MLSFALPSSFSRSESLLLGDALDEAFLPLEVDTLGSDCEVDDSFGKGSSKSF